MRTSNTDYRSKRSCHARYFETELNDSVDIISKGTHERFIIDAEKFNSKVKEKAIN
ncbi:MAG: hypothetical protein JRD84_04895 [Deltaproteobacteria bacterium]|nr:hypothetical protein [Deltaproteobacteria bacterium]